MPWFLRDSDGDLCYFVHHGTGVLETDYGPLRYRDGDFLVLPKGTTHRVVPAAGNGGNGETFLYCIEGRGEYALPEKGILGRHAIFDPGVLETPEPEPHDEQGEFQVQVKRDDEYTTLTYPFHPLDVVGWQGDLCPIRLNVEDIRPVVSPRYHLPPSVHVTFKSKGFEIGTFAPRPTETGDPTALRVPFFHSNIDKDEVLFYHRGQFFSRAGIGEGFITHHPQGLHHGPQPAALGSAGFGADLGEGCCCLLELIHGFLSAASCVEQVGHVAVKGRLAVAVALGRAELESLLGQRDGLLEVTGRRPDLGQVVQGGDSRGRFGKTFRQRQASLQLRAGFLQVSPA